MDNPPHKDVSLARSHRDRGNTLFEQGQYKRAAFEYTQVRVCLELWLVFFLFFFPPTHEGQ